MVRQVAVQRQHQRLLFDTFVQKENLVARAMWVAVEPLHRPIVRDLLEQASLRERLRAIGASTAVGPPAATRD
jgi:hypothetical protein